MVITIKDINNPAKNPKVGNALFFNVLEESCGFDALSNT